VKVGELGGRSLSHGCFGVVGEAVKDVGEVLGGEVPGHKRDALTDRRVGVVRECGDQLGLA
jgi:hypothetical protein